MTYTRVGCIYFIAALFRLTISPVLHSSWDTDMCVCNNRLRACVSQFSSCLKRLCAWWCRRKGRFRRKWGRKWVRDRMSDAIDVTNNNKRRKRIRETTEQWVKFLVVSVSARSFVSKCVKRYESRETDQRVASVWGEKFSNEILRKELKATEREDFRAFTPKTREEEEEVLSVASIDEADCGGTSSDDGCECESRARVSRLGFFLCERSYRNLSFLERLTNTYNSNSGSLHFLCALILYSVSSSSLSSSPHLLYRT